MADDGSVLGNLPRSRPGQRSEKRDRGAAAKAAPKRGPKAERPAKAAEKAAARAEESGAAAAKPVAEARQASRARPRPAAGGRRAAGAAAGEEPRGRRAAGPAAGEKAGAAKGAEGDPVGQAIRATAKLAGTGARVAGTVAQEVLRRLPRP
jgi:hypothetical protein